MNSLWEDLKAENWNDRHIDKDLESKLDGLRKLVKKAHEVLERHRSLQAPDSRGETDAEPETPYERALFQGLVLSATKADEAWEKAQADRYDALKAAEVQEASSRLTTLLTKIGESRPELMP